MGIVEPRTEAGRQLVAAFPSQTSEAASPEFIRHMVRAILAIEAEASPGTGSDQHEPDTSQGDDGHGQSPAEASHNAGPAEQHVRLGVIPSTRPTLRGAALIVDGLWAEPDDGPDRDADLIWMTSDETAMRDALRALRRALADAP